MPPNAKPKPTSELQALGARSDAPLGANIDGGAKQGSAPTDRATADVDQLAVELVRTGTQWLDSSTVEAIARPENSPSTIDSSHPKLLAQQWADEGRIFGIPQDGRVLFPAYAFEASGEPVSALKDILAVLRGMSEFSIAAWFESTSSTLGGQRPRELLDRDSDAVLAAARALREGPQHG